MIQYIYFLFKNQEIVYIGLTQYLDNRVSSHKRDGKVFDSVKSFQVQYCHNRSHAIERELIKIFKPMYNGDCITGRKSYSDACLEINQPKVINIRGDEVYPVRVSACENLEYQTKLFP